MFAGLIKLESIGSISLTQGHVAIVNSCDIDLRSFNWRVLCHGSKDNPLFYAVTHDPFCHGRHVYMHRFIMERVLDVELMRCEFVDHIDHNGLNNVRSNLRIVSHSENMFNQRKQKGKTSRYKGVFWDKVNSKWVSQIKRDGVLMCLGSFDDERDAALSYNDAAIKMFKHVACLNLLD